MTWGSPSGAVAGETLSVPYTTDEAVTSAVLILADSRVLAMAVEPDALSVALPADTPDGLATVRARDDVLNAVSLAVDIDGVATSYVVLELDTTPPNVTWGPHDGAIAGETLTVPYLCDEEIDSAIIRFADGREMAMVVTPTAFILDVPDDAIDGTATVYARDDVLNATGYSFNLSGVLPTPPPARSAGGTPNLPVRVNGGRSHGRFASRTRVRQRSTHATMVAFETTHGATVRRREVQRIAVTTRLTPATTASQVSRLAALSSEKITRRMDPPGGESELLLIDLL